MKREFVQGLKDHSNGIFSKLRRPTTAASDETDTHDSGRKNENDPLPPPPPPPNDGSTIEVVRRPRGRPPGSKNKPKPPVFIAQGSPPEQAMGPYVLELPPGVDVVESTTRFCRRRNIGLCVLNGNGVVTNVTLKQPSAPPGGAALTFEGCFDILSISATILPAGGLPVGNGPFTIFVAGRQGQVMGGHVVGPLVSAGTTYLIATTFNSPSFLRLQQAGQGDPPRSDGGYEPPEPTQAVAGGDSGGAPMYSYQLSDVIWAPTARQPPPPY